MPSSIYGKLIYTSSAVSYGELGSMIIHQALFTLFPPSSMDTRLIKPFTPTEFIELVLVPEVAVRLIMEDNDLDPDDKEHNLRAVNIMRESAQYGVSMFPDPDTNGDKRGVHDGVRNAADDIAVERATARRQELAENDDMEIEKKSSKRMKRERRSSNQEQLKKRPGSGSTRPRPLPRKQT